MTGVPYEGLPRYDDSFYTSLARILSEEPVIPRDRAMMGMLLPLGIEKGKPFKPDASMSAALKLAAEEAQAWLIDGLVRTSPKFWPEGSWVVPAPPAGIPSLFTFEMDGIPDGDSRGILFASAFAAPAKPGAASWYVGTFFDSAGRSLSGEYTYRLRVPAKVPVSQYWSLTVYDLQTSGLFRESTRLAVDSLDKNLKKNADGSVDIYIGPKAPAGQESNWLFTPQGKRWYPWVRFYGPEPALFDKTWKLPEIERLG